MPSPAEPPVIRPQIAKTFPPNIDSIRAKFSLVAGHRGLLFTYGPTIHNPDGVEIANHLIQHELVHVRQQSEVGGPEKWWKLYIADQSFRLRQEMEASIIEYQAFCAGPPLRNRRARHAHLDTISEHLSSGIYGHMIRRQAAKSAIVRGVEQLERDSI